MPTITYDKPSSGYLFALDDLAENDYDDSAAQRYLDFRL